jgi:MarR-like DNA-binding transcriptional regulator SgrR of sgrS sRNA
MAAAVLAITAQLSFAADARRLARRLEDGCEVVALHRGRRQPHRPAQRQAVENLHHRRHDAGQAAPTDTVQITVP